MSTAEPMTLGLEAPPRYGITRAWAMPNSETFSIPRVGLQDWITRIEWRYLASLPQPDPETSPRAR